MPQESSFFRQPLNLLVFALLADNSGILDFVKRKCNRKVENLINKNWQVEKTEKLKELEILRKIWKDIKSEKNDKFNNKTSAMFNTYLVSTLKFQFEKNYKFNNITSAMFNAYLISTLKYEKNKMFLSNSKKSEKIKK